MYFLYSSHFGQGFVSPKRSKISPHIIDIVTTPEVYRVTNNNGKRSGTAYLVRKGKNKHIIHDLTDSIKIDGKSHAEIAEIFNRVETFISYDAATAYTRFAMLCGCRSVIILGEDETPDTYCSKESQKYISFGLNDYFPDIEQARLWAESLRDRSEKDNDIAVTHFIEDTEEFFHCKLR